MVNAPVTNKKVKIATINDGLPDGASINYLHTCDLDFPSLPDEARKAHVIPGLVASSLLYVG
jgi:hypothetical protein